MKVLQINSGLNGEKSNSTKLSNMIVDRLKDKASITELLVKDLSVNPIPHLDGETLQGFHDETLAVSDKQKDALKLSNDLVAELQTADVLVLGVPMYNLAIPSTLKCWIDYIARARVTFQYTETGVEGLLRNKKAYIAAARGGFYANTPADNQTEYLKMALGFIGITDVEFVYAEGLAINPEAAEYAMSQANEDISKIMIAA